MRKAIRFSLVALTFLFSLSGMACSKNTAETKTVNSGAEVKKEVPLTGEPIKEASSANNVTPAPKAQATDEDLGAVLSKAKTSDNYYYEFIVKDGTEVSMSTKTWVKGKKFRIDVESDGQESSMFVDDEKGEYFMYTKAENTAIKVSIPAGNTSYNPFTYVGTLDKSSFKGYKKGNTESVDGNKCTVYSYEYQGNKVVIYVDEQYGIILKCDNYTDGKLVSSIHFKDFKVGNVTEETVTIPKNATIVKLN
jgi:hypothetical protein